MATARCVSRSGCANQSMELLHSPFEGEVELELLIVKDCDWKLMLTQQLDGFGFPFCCVSRVLLQYVGSCGSGSGARCPILKGLAVQAPPSPSRLWVKHVILNYTQWGWRHYAWCHGHPLVCECVSGHCKVI